MTTADRMNHRMLAKVKGPSSFMASLLSNRNKSAQGLTSLRVCFSVLEHQRNLRCLGLEGKKNKSSAHVTACSIFFFSLK